MSEEKGLGDAVEVVLKFTGIKKIHEKVTGESNCTPCKKRKEMLNKVKITKLIPNGHNKGSRSED